MVWCHIRSQGSSKVPQNYRSRQLTVEGPYAPAVLRFQIRFPPRYPATPPSITFSSDIFHPLVTPLTTYTYTTGSSNSDTVSAADEERLRPGGFDLRHGFPQWFKRASNSQGSSKASSRNVSESQARETGLSDDAIAPFALRAIDVPEPSRPTLFQAAQLGIVSPQLRALVTPHVSIVEVLRYMKLSFEDATTLDVLPYDTVGNPGAWHAWRAHRKTTKEEISRALAKNENSDDVIYRQRSSAIMGNLADPIPKPPGEWNWDGVWAERVKKGVNATVSEPVLYGDAEDNELVCLDPEPY